MNARNAAARLRAIGLALVWVLPGVWCTGHVLAHELEPGHHDLQAVVSAGGCLTGVTEDHRHGHDHPEWSPAVAPDGSKKIDASTPLAANLEFDASNTSLRYVGPVAAGYRARLALSPSEPRAPPIS